MHSPIALQRAIFFYVGKTFCLRGGEEQRKLKPSQFRRSYDPDCYTYIEHGSKNNSGTSVKEANKTVPVFSCPDARPRCLVYLLDKYFEKLPAKADRLDVFYLRPRVTFTPDSVWYDCVPVGIHKLKKFMDSMCSEAGIQEKKTNHSLRATGATALFNAGVPEKVIREVTGHRSNALLTYQRPTLEQKQEASSILVQGKRKFDPGKENVPLAAMQPSTSVRGAGLFGPICSGVTNITVNMSSNNSNSYTSDATNIAGLLDGIDMDKFFMC